MIRTIIVDDEILSRIGIQSFIDTEEDIVVAETFGMAADAVEFLKENRVDIVITDIEMADMNGLEFIDIIRSQDLADGVIIISCHDDFAYAQEAISKGTDSYVLKHNIKKDFLINEIHKVYGKTHKVKHLHADAGENLFSKTTDMEGDGIYRLGVLRVKFNEVYSSDSGQHMEGAMLVHLLEGIVDRYQMGTLFAPYNKEIFAIFQLNKELSAAERNALMEADLSSIDKNIRQYMNGGLIYGISGEFEDLRETRERYEEAVAAADLSFYEPEKHVFYYREQGLDISAAAFTSGRFLEKDGMEIFEKELDAILQKAYFQRWPVRQLKEQLIQNISILGWDILKEHNFSQEFVQECNAQLLSASSVNQARSMQELKECLADSMRSFHTALLHEIKTDDLAAAFSYIEQNLREKITLAELADICCMSIPSFCKKFKDRTGMTLVQYMNEKRIEKAKILLQNKSYSLWEISEKTGFSNANYLIRVFKKVTDQTVSEYRRLFGIDEEKWEE